ncbi:hypothetical protein [Microbulbifer sp. THAF38]|uniref:hypothetical protein n=1 Tax=Microbulbifer sp. THAF38 TaxID=2587856 RepID=UPI0012693B27|nr:hypothetical protein [Microbulbifer sp. THAF38]QFT53048.1 hypothetical protein FIU95_00440 [Microbulbifer sp. THAF38]
MLNKTQSISARLSAEDYAYLMSIDRNGAITQSEKVREIIAMARESVGGDSLSRSYLSSAEAMLPLKARYLEENQRSLLIEAVMELLTESAAIIQNGASNEPMAPELEKDLLPSVEAFLEKMLLLSQQSSPRSIHRDSAAKIRERLESETAE